MEAGIDKDEQTAGRDFLSSLTESWRCTEEYLVSSTDPGERWYECDLELQPPVKHRRKKKGLRRKNRKGGVTRRENEEIERN